ncbi:MAG: 2,4-dihydroxyhept-2-ene-1,7-dioic acid aldolase [Actinomycetia bacterium]|nr:2,4-dihydroxyhept-2-ene-1,7-dioic acid aldolase [Actinomycetes bacterium]
MQNPLKDLWAEGGAAHGGWLSVPSTATAEAMGRVGFDYLCIDMQHGLSDYQVAVTMLQALDTSPTPTICRVPWNEPGIIGRMLDAGAMAVIIPMVNSVDEAVQATRACRYAPDGSRSWGPIRAGALHPGYSPASANAGVACIPMIESRQAVESIDDILQVPGIDAIYVGPADLSVSLGLPPASDNDGEFAEAIDTILAGCDRHGVVPGIHTTPGLAPKRRDQGFRMMTVTADAGALAAGAQLHLQQGRGDGGEDGSMY